MAPGETLTYYIVNDDYVVVDTGVIDDLSNGYYLYSYTNEKGIKYSFLKNGSFYWDDTLDFVWTDPNGYQYHNDQIITLSERYITVYEDVYSYTVTGTVYDAEGNILGQADCTYIQEQGYLDVTIGDTSYYEYSSSPTLAEFVVYSIKLQGKDLKGNDIDFSNYYIKWNVSCYLISYSVNPEEIYVGNELYNSISGVFDNISSNGFCYFNLKVKKRLSNYICFNFTFDVYNSNNELVKTVVISSDEIVSNQIKSNISIGNNSSYEIENNSNYNSWNNNYNFDGIDNWQIDDFKNYLGTGNFIWQFMKAILFGLPSWITVPMYILLSGVVVITLLKLIRGG